MCTQRSASVVLLRRFSNASQIAAIQLRTCQTATAWGAQDVLLRLQTLHCLGTKTAPSTCTLLRSCRYGETLLTRLPRMEAASVITSLQVSQKSFSADSSCACMRRAAAFATNTGGKGATYSSVLSSVLEEGTPMESAFWGYAARFGQTKGSYYIRTCGVEQDSCVSPYTGRARPGASASA